jgi:hypothetical protein
MKRVTKTLIFLFVLSFVLLKANAQVSVAISANIAPPELPVYEQPECPVDGYLWQPGYWAYNDEDGYYWVPGVWVAPPNPGLLWTPAYWGFEGGRYGFHAGYWGPHIGFYGGINYGYGYGGVGFVGGRWDGGHFRYNTAVLRINRVVVRNVYEDRTVIRTGNVNVRVSFNGAGGIVARPGREELIAMRERHIPPTREQRTQQMAASRDRSQFARANGGHPGAAAMDKVGGRPVDEHGKEATSSRLGRSNMNRPETPQRGQKPEGADKPNGQKPERADKPNGQKPERADKPNPQRPQKPDNGNKPARTQPARQQPQRSQQPKPQQPRPPQQKQHPGKPKE